MDKKGMVFLIGAGPGDPGLLTVKGRFGLEQAEVVIYDRLCSSALLSYAPSEALLIDVGKGTGEQQYSQAEINGFLIKYGLEGKRVVRLQGGDPFLFGRGGEEALALRDAGVPFEIVPGVSAAIAVPAYAGIPVTHCGMAAAVTIVYGHEMAEKSEPRINWEAISQASQTLVILMGTANLEVIVSQLQSAGLTESVPVAIIENGTMANQRVVLGTLKNIVPMATAASIKSPAVIVVGKVVDLASRLEWITRQKPLLGKRIIITRPAIQAVNLVEKIGITGGEPLICPTIHVNLVNSADAGEMIQAVTNANWLVFTSQNGVNGFFKLLSESGRDSRFIHNAKVAAIGAKTGETLLEKGILADLIPENYTAADLCEKLGPQVRGKRVVLLQVDKAPPELIEGLKEYGGEVTEFPVYHVESEIKFATKILEYLTSKTVDAIIFTSPSTVKGFLENIQGDLSLLDDVKVICIGPVTADFAREYYINVAGVAVNGSSEDLVAALISLFKGDPL